MVETKRVIEWLHLDCDTFLGHHQVLSRLKLPWHLLLKYTELIRTVYTAVMRCCKRQRMHCFSVENLEGCSVLFNLSQPRQHRMLGQRCVICCRNLSICTSRRCRCQVPQFERRCFDQVALIRKPYLVPGSTLIFDDILNYPGYEDHALRAFYNFIQDYCLNAADTKSCHRISVKADQCHSFSVKTCTC